MKKLHFYCLVVCLLFSTSTLTSCSDDDGDTEKPVIRLKAPEEGEILFIGYKVHFCMELEDNQMLSSYRVNIHSNFDGHDHAHIGRHAGEETVDFSFDKSWDVSGKKSAEIHHYEIMIPENATPGNYHLIVYCTDEAGNEAHVARNIILEKD